MRNRYRWSVIILQLCNPSLLQTAGIPTIDPIIPPQNISTSAITGTNSIPMASSSTVSAVDHSTVFRTSSSSIKDASLSVALTTSVHLTTSVSSSNSSAPSVVAKHNISVSEPIIITVTICMMVLIISALVITAYLIQKKIRHKRTHELEPQVMCTWVLPPHDTMHWSCVHPVFISPDHVFILFISSDNTDPSSHSQMTIYRKVRNS